MKSPSLPHLSSCPLLPPCSPSPLHLSFLFLLLFPLPSPLNRVSASDFMETEAPHIWNGHRAKLLDPTAKWPRSPGHGGKLPFTLLQGMASSRGGSRSFIANRSCPQRAPDLPHQTEWVQWKLEVDRRRKNKPGWWTGCFPLKSRVRRVDMVLQSPWLITTQCPDHRCIAA